MAIQLNERDYLIFKLLAEHNVLLEKHIAWFISQEDKPVLIRDRLRKLFYLDYLLCQRYDNKLPWWTTPTKPLVYMLTPLARTMSGNDKDGHSETMDNEATTKIFRNCQYQNDFSHSPKRRTFTKFSMDHIHPQPQIVSNILMLLFLAAAKPTIIILVSSATLPQTSSSTLKFPKA